MIQSDIDNIIAGQRRFYGRPCTLTKSVPITWEQLFLYTVAASTLLAAAGEIKLFEFALRGWAWAIVLVVSLFYLLPGKRTGPLKHRWYLWVPWFLWVAYKTDFSDVIALQRLGMFITPFLALCAASTLKNMSITMIKKSYRFLLIGSLCIYAIAVAHSRSLIVDAEWYSIAGIAMTFTLLAVSLSAGIVEAPLSGLVLLSLLFSVMLFTKSRMPILILPAVLILGYTGLKAKVRVILCVVMICAGLLFFKSGPVQENLFHRGHGSISDAYSLDPEVVNLSGRLTAWPLFIQGIENIWFGDGSTASVTYGNATFGAGKWSHPHNEYIRMLFDYGIVGLALLSIPLIWLLNWLYKKGRSYDAADARLWLHFVGANGIIAMLLLGISGNVLMYAAYIGNMVFATVGCAFALSSNK